MKLLLDENLSQYLVPKLLDVFPGTIHVADVDRLRTPEPDIWHYEK
jgi:predicted nuclease of predicted toxin-antitoxin system